MVRVRIKVRVRGRGRLRLRLRFRLRFRLRLRVMDGSLFLYARFAFELTLQPSLKPTSLFDELFLDSSLSLS